MCAQSILRDVGPRTLFVPLTPVLSRASFFSSRPLSIECVQASTAGGSLGSRLVISRLRHRVVAAQARPLRCGGGEGRGGCARHLVHQHLGLRCVQFCLANLGNVTKLLHMFSGRVSSATRSPWGRRGGLAKTSGGHLG